MDESVIVCGEAPETDSEEEITTPKLSPTKSVTAIQGSVITGEDSESEDENAGSISSAVSALHVTQSRHQDTKKVAASYDTLLHQKLRETNLHLRHDVESFCDNVVKEARKNLADIDQHLLRSQNTLQGALSSLRSLNVNSIGVKNKLNLLLSAKFIPNINVMNISKPQ